MSLYSLKTYRRALASAFDDLGVYPATGSSTTSVASGFLADSTPGAATSRYDGRWVYSYSPQAAQRRVISGGFAPASGTLTVTPAWAAPTLGTEIEVTGMFPCESMVPGEDLSYKTLLNRGGDKLLIPDRIQVPITTAQEYVLTPYQAWLDRPDRLVGIWEPPAAGSLPVDSGWRGWRLQLRTGAPRLEVRAPFSGASAASGGVVTLDVLRPATTKVSGVESTLGLVYESDLLDAQVGDLVLVSMVEACLVMMTRTVGRPDGGDWAKRYEDLRAKAEQLFWFDGGFYKPAAMRPAAAAA